MKPPEKRYRKIAVLQLSRIGDILMSLPVLESLSKTYREADISFFINGMFEDLLPASSYFKTIPIQFNTLCNALMESESIPDALKIIEDELERYIDSHFDLIINLSSQRVSAILTALFNAEDKHGLVLSKDDTLIHTHPDLSLFTTIKTGRKFNWVHQVEIYLSSVAGGKPSPLYMTGNYLFDHWLDEFIDKRVIEENYILISPGASIPEKELGNTVLEPLLRSILMETDYWIVLSGTETEAIRYERFCLPDSNRIIDYSGKTADFKELFNLIHHSECLISNDSGPMHMAALLNKRNIVFSMGSAFFPETMAYNHDVLFFTPKSDCYPCPWIDFQCEKGASCKETVDLENVIKHVLAYLSGEFPEPAGPVTVGYKTIINKNGLFFQPQGKAGLPVIEFWGLMYQSFWKEKLFHIDAHAALNDICGQYYILPYDFRSVYRDWQAQLERWREFLDQLLYRFAQIKRNNDPQLLNHISSGIDAIYSLSDQDTVLTPLLQYYKIQYHSIHTDNPRRILEAYHKITLSLKEDLHRLDELFAVIDIEQKAHTIPSEPGHVYLQPGESG